MLLQDLKVPECLLLEGIVTTLNADQSTNISPLGPIVDASFQWLRLRPYQTSTTYANLSRTREGVLHVTDDVELFAQAAIGKPDPQPPMRAAVAVCGSILIDACRWYAFRIEHVESEKQPAEMLGRVVDSGRQRDFFGFNRAKHAVIEAAILATRIAFLPRPEILADFSRLATAVHKTGGHAERRAFALLDDYVRTTQAQVRVAPSAQEASKLP
jgi:hypothetical protein